jgi:hypothetical protein
VGAVQAVGQVPILVEHLGPHDDPLVWLRHPDHHPGGPSRLAAPDVILELEAITRLLATVNGCSIASQVLNTARPDTVGEPEVMEDEPIIGVIAQRFVSVQAARAPRPGYA